LLYDAIATTKFVSPKEVKIIRNDETGEMWGEAMLGLFDGKSTVPPFI
jgi:hypothetical protein